jgi:hypothetical protein
VPTKPTTTTAPVDLGTARRQLAEAEAEAARQRADVAALAADALALREQRLAEFDATAMAKLTERIGAARAEEATALAELRAATLADPVYDAYVRVLAARTTRWYLDQELATAARRVGREHRVVEGYTTPPLAEMVAGIVDREARNRAADVIDAHHADREAAGAGPEGTPGNADRNVEVTLATTPDGRQVRVTRNLRTGAQTTVDVETGQPYSPPTRRAPVDDGVANGAQLDRRGLAAGDGWVRTPVDW